MRVLTAAAAILPAAGTAAATPLHLDFAGGDGSRVHGFDKTGACLGATITPVVYRDGDTLKRQPTTIGRRGNGLSVRGSGASDHRVDGRGDDNAIPFSFDETVKRLSAEFSSADHNGDVEVFLSMVTTSGPVVRRDLPTNASGHGRDVATA